MKKSKKLWLIIGTIVILIIAILFSIRILSGEDNWICENGQWTQYGHPSAPKPLTGCGEVTKVTKDTTPEEMKYPIAETYNVPVLMYHYIRNAEGEGELGKNLSVSPTAFAEQMQTLKNAGYVSIKLSDLADPEKKVISKVIYEKKKPIVISFDDGYEDALTKALPILKENGFIGTFFIIRDFVGRPEYLSQDQIDELEKAGMEIGSHSLDHPNFAESSIDTASKEIADSKGTATTFCYPSGKFNNTVVSLVKEAGYLAAVTTQAGIADQTSDLFELPRVRVQESTGQALLSRLE